MAEKKIKKTEVSTKSASTTGKATNAWVQKTSSVKKASPAKTTTKKTGKKVTTTETPKTKKPRTVTQNPEAKTFSEKRTFSTGSLGKRAITKPQAEKKAPTWVVVIFIFSLVFFLFSLYKVFIYKGGYSPTHQISLPLWIQNSEGSWSFQAEPESWTLRESEVPSRPESELWDWDLMLQDAQLIQNFYSYLTNNQIEEMNALVDRPLKNSITRTNHWNKKNIGIFTKHLSDTVLLQDLFLVPHSANPEKKTRQYSYTLKYTINPGQSFTEDWELTLITRWDQNLIAEIMCKTEGCSHSPFFWPQNYGLK